MAERRRYTKRQKMTAVIAADMTSVLSASETTGIPYTTIDYWMDQPEFVKLRENARERMADETLTVARLAWGKLAERIRSGEIETRDLVMATGMATDKAQLLSGGATARTETRDISGTLSDADVIAALRAAEDYARAGGGGTAEETEGTPTG